MPTRWYAHDCCYPGRSRSGSPTCLNCGARGRYVGWGLSMTEAQNAFSRATGLPPYGPGRESPEGQAIIARLVACGLCDRTGLIQDRANDTWAWCPACGGNRSAIDGCFRPDTKGAQNDPTNGILRLKELAGTRRCPSCRGPWYWGGVGEDPPEGSVCPRCERGG